MNNQEPSPTGRGESYRVAGTVLDNDVKRGVGGLRVELWEHARDAKAPVAAAQTDVRGTFEVGIEIEAYHQQFPNRRPRFFIRVLHGDQEIGNLRGQMSLRLSRQTQRVLVGVDLADVVRGIFWEKVRHPHLLPTVPNVKSPEVRINVVDNPQSGRTLGDLGFAIEIKGSMPFSEDWILVVPYTAAQVDGLDTKSIRMFTHKKAPFTLEPIWNSSVNPEAKFIWAYITQPGVYIPLGLPRDRLVMAALDSMARERRRLGGADAREENVRKLFASTLGALADFEDDELDQLRLRLTNAELQTRTAPIDPADIRIGQDGIFEPFALPGAGNTKEFRARLKRLEISPAGLPEEALLFPPDRIDTPQHPWPARPGPSFEPPSPIPDPDAPLPIPWPPRPLPFPRPPFDFFEPLFPLDPRRFYPWILCLLGRRNWWMYHRDEHLSGAAGCSFIRSTNIAQLQPLLPTPIGLHGEILSIPAIVNGKIYIGTATSTISGRSGTVYKFDLASGTKEAEFPLPTSHATRPGEVPLQGARQGGRPGVASSPAVVGGRVYVSTLTGFLYCLDAGSLACLWYTDLRKRHLSKNQPIDHGTIPANGWSSPLVVNNRIYVGFGEGENNTFGFVYCLDASNGRVIWIYCTNKYVNPSSAGSENQPNVLPPSLSPASLPSGFSKAASDPANFGASPWSHASYDRGLNRIYIGTGNSRPDNPLPEPRYSNGVISLDATTGEFRSYFQPPASSNYRPGSSENDIDVPAGPMIFQRGSQRFVGIGSKNGSFFLLNPSTLAVVQQRQMLPYSSTGAPFSDVDPVPGSSENRSGVMATAAVSVSEQTLFVPVGGYAGTDSIDFVTTPFMRAVDWATLNDAWPTTGINPPKYSNVGATMYTRAGEAGMASPATVNDVVFMSTTSSGLYAFQSGNGLHLRTLVAAGSSSVAGSMGPAIYGDYVVAGFFNGNLHIFKLQP